MKVLLTGAFGNVGLSVIDELKARGHETNVFDLKTKKNRKFAKNLRKSYVKLTWGDIRDFPLVEKATADCDCIIHLAAIVPPKSEKNKKLCDEININGTENVLRAAKSEFKSIPIIYISSASIMGPTQVAVPPVNTGDSINPITTYAKSKAKAEDLVRKSGLDHCILRLASVLDSGADYHDDMLELLFDFPLEARNEIILDSDAASAIVTAAEKIITESTINNMTFFIGGGAKNGCRITNRTMIKGMFTAMGIGLLSERCFNPDLSDFCMDWYDTEKSNEILDYQHHSFKDYLKFVEKKTESGGFFVKIMAPRLKSAMELQSPYYKKAIKEK